MNWEEYIRQGEALDRFRYNYLHALYNKALLDQQRRAAAAMRRIIAEGQKAEFSYGSADGPHDTFETAKPVSGMIIDEP